MLAEDTNKRKVNVLKIAIPTENNSLAKHFGRCEKYVFFEVEDNKIINKYEKISPQHAPSVIPEFLKEEETDLVITSGIGRKAIDLFQQFEIDIITGCSGDVDKIIKEYLAGTLVSGESTCKHEENV